MPRTSARPATAPPPLTGPWPAGPLLTDHVTADYLVQAGDPAHGRGAWEPAAPPPALAAAAGRRLLPRPLFAPQEHVERAAADSIALFDLITALPQRLFDGDLDAYCAALGIDARTQRLLTRLGGGAPPMYGRTDMNYDGTSLRLLEFNIASELGGIDRAGTLPRLWAAAPGFARFAAEHRLAHLDTGRLVADTLRRAAATVAPGGRAPRVALLEAPGGLARFGAVWQALAELMRGQGLDFTVAELPAIRRRGQRIVLGGTPVDLVLRCFSAEELLALPDGEALVEPVLAAHRAGTAVLWTPMEAHLFSNKGCLALLSRPDREARFTRAELALIDRILPWTRALPADPARHAPDLLEECLARKDELILKPTAGYGGAGVVAGWETTTAAWHRHLRAVDRHGAVVQQRLVPRPEPVRDPATGTTGDWRTVWSLFLTPAGHAGSYARAVPADQGAVVGMGANPLARTAAVFTFPRPQAH